MNKQLDIESDETKTDATILAVTVVSVSKSGFTAPTQHLQLLGTSLYGIIRCRILNVTLF